MAQSSPTQFSKRLENEGYKRWLLSGHGLLILKQAVSPFVETKMNSFHQDLLQAFTNATCQNCKSKAIQLKNKKWSFLKPCPNKICDQWLDQIVKEHKYSKQKQSVNWTNARVQLWPKESWEVAKVYMDRGQKSGNTGPETSDISAILSLIENCLRFDKDFTNMALVTDVKHSRNVTMHSANMSLTNQELTTNLDKMFKFLEDPAGMLQIDNCITAVKELKKLQDPNFSIVELHRTEIKLLQERMSELEQSLSDVVEDQEEHAQRIQEISSTLTKIVESKDLYDSLQEQVAGLLEGHTEVKDALNALEKKINSVGDRSKEDVEDLRQRIEALETTPKSSSGVSDYKGKLQHYCQLQDKPLPDYTSLTPPSGSGFKSEVTVFDRKFVSPGTYRRLKDAHQAAAEVALQELGLLETPKPNEDTEEMVEEDHIISDSTLNAEIPARDELDAILVDNLHQEKAAYRITARTNSHTKEYSAQVTCHLPKTIQVPSMASKKATAEQEAAEMVLKKCGLSNTSTSAKNTLYAYCGEKYKTAPRYVVQQNKSGSTIVVQADCITEAGEVKCDGGYCENEVSAIENAATKFIELVKELKLNEPKNSEVKTVDSSPEATQKSGNKATSNQTSTIQATGNQAGTSKTSNNQASSSQATSDQATSSQETNSQATGTSQATSSQAGMSQATTIQATSSQATSSQATSKPAALSNPKGALLEYFQKKQFLTPKITTESNKEGFKGKIIMTNTFSLPPNESTVKKIEAEKKIASYACEKVLKETVDITKAKNKLQEYCQKRKLDVPHYETVTVEGKCTSSVKFTIIVESEQSFKKEKEAEKDVCIAALSIVTDEVGSLATGNQATSKPAALSNPKGALLEYFQKKQYPKPNISTEDNNGRFKSKITMTNTFKLPPGESTAKKVDAEKKIASYACEKVLKEAVDVAKAKNKLQEYCQKRKLEMPHYEIINLEDGKFTSSVKFTIIVDSEQSFESKTEAERDACVTALSIVNDEE